LSEELTSLSQRKFTFDIEDI